MSAMKWHHTGGLGGRAWSGMDAAGPGTAQVAAVARPGPCAVPALPVAMPVAARLVALARPEDLAAEGLAAGELADLVPPVVAQAAGGVAGRVPATGPLAVAVLAVGALVHTELAVRAPAASRPDRARKVIVERRALGPRRALGRAGNVRVFRPGHPAGRPPHVARPAAAAKGQMTGPVLAPAMTLAPAVALVPAAARAPEAVPVPAAVLVPGVGPVARVVRIPRAAPVPAAVPAPAAAAPVPAAVPVPAAAVRGPRAAREAGPGPTGLIAGRALAPRRGGPSRGTAGRVPVPAPCPMFRRA